MNDINDNGLTTDELIEQNTKTLIEAASNLESLGLSRTSLYDLLRQNLAKSNHAEMLRQSSIRHIEMLKEVIKGRNAGEVRAEYGLGYMGRKAVLHDGAKKIHKELDIKNVSVTARSPLDPANRDYWLELADKALNNLANQNIKEH